MADVFTKRKRSKIMSAVRGKNTAPERILKATLSEMGLKLEANAEDLPGSPDAVLRSRKVAIFVSGCFWHGHVNCPRAKLPTTRRAFWKKKIHGNIRRDRRQLRQLRTMGWRVLTFWTCRKITPMRVTGRLRQIHVRVPGTGKRRN